MKRFITITLVLLMLLTVFGCTPDNIVSPTPTPDDTQTGSDAGVPAPEPDKETETDPGQEEQEAPDKTEKNTGVRPSFDIDSLEYLNVKTKDLKDKTVALYVGDSSFSAGDMTEAQWLFALKEEYGLAVDYKVCADSVLYSSQMIAQKSGKSLDLVSVKINDIAAALSLVQSADEFITKTANDPFSARVYELSGNKLFAGKGDAKMLWFNTAIVKDAPYDNWTFEDFVKIAESVKTSGNGVLETDSFAELYSCGEKQITGFDAQSGYIMDVNDVTAKSILADFAKNIAIESEEEKSFIRGNVAFTYTSAPLRRNMELSWAPLPKYGENGTNAVSLCGSALGLSKTIPEENVDTAITLAMLWSARYTESREDALRFDLGLFKASYDEYVKLSEQSGLIYAADSEINSCFAGGEIPEYYYLDNEELPENEEEEETEETDNILLAYERAELINNRYYK